MKPVMHLLNSDVRFLKQCLAHFINYTIFGQKFRPINIKRVFIR